MWGEGRPLSHCIPDGFLLGFGVQVSECRVQGLGFRVSCCRTGIRDGADRLLGVSRRELNRHLSFFNVSENLAENIPSDSRILP